MITTPLRIALIGCGAIAIEHHLPTIAASPDLQLAVACDIDLSKAQQTAANFGAPMACADWRDALDQDVDFVLLCTHPSIRLTVIIAALERRLPVYTEKPLACTATEATLICDEARRSNIPVCVGYNRRSAPAIDALRELVAAARRGDALAAPVFRRDTDSRHRLPEESQTQILIRVNDDARTWKPWAFGDNRNALYDCTGHMLDVALGLLDSPPVRVYASGSQRGNFTEILTCADGSMVTLQYTLCGNFAWPKERYEISLRNVMIACEDFVEIEQVGLHDVPPTISFPLHFGADLTSRSGLAGYKEAQKRFASEDVDRSKLSYPYICPDKGHSLHLQRFANHLRGHGANPFPPEDAERLIILLEAFMTSLRTNRSLAAPF